MAKCTIKEIAGVTWKRVRYIATLDPQLDGLRAVTYKDLTLQEALLAVEHFYAREGHQATQEQGNGSLKNIISCPACREIHAS